MENRAPSWYRQRIDRRLAMQGGQQMIRSLATLIYAVSLSVVAISSSMAEELTGLPLAGKSFAQQHCSRCHVVGPGNPFGGISSTPSFSLMVNELADWQERFETFPARLPHPSIIRFKGEKVDPDAPILNVPIELEYDDIAALTAYALTLQKR